MYVRKYDYIITIIQEEYILVLYQQAMQMVSITQLPTQLTMITVEYLLLIVAQGSLAEQTMRVLLLQKL